MTRLLVIVGVGAVAGVLLIRMITDAHCASFRKAWFSLLLPKLRVMRRWLIIVGGSVLSPCVLVVLLCLLDRPEKPPVQISRAPQVVWDPDCKLWYDETILKLMKRESK